LSIAHGHFHIVSHSIDHSIIFATAIPIHVPVPVLCALLGHALRTCLHGLANCNVTQPFNLVWQSCRGLLTFYLQRGSALLSF
jgi:hypothetical protein